MPIDNELVMDAPGEAKRGIQFRETVKQQGDTIESTLRGMSRKMWGVELPVETQTRERLVSSLKPHPYEVEKEWEALWYAINREKVVRSPIIMERNGQTQTISYEAIAVSLLSVINRPPVLTIGRPRHFEIFADGIELLDWDEFRKNGTTANRRSLAQLTRIYTAHGPSKVFRTIFLPLERAQYSKTTIKSEA